MAPSHVDRGVVHRQLDGFTSRWIEKIGEWDDKERGHSEKRHAQTFWSDLLRQFGVIPERISLFEYEADRATTGNRGWIDVFWSGVFIGEAKSVGKDLEVAEKQAFDYLAGGSIAAHEFPRFSICTDFESFRVTRLGDDKWTVTFPLAELPDHVDQLMFLAGHETITKKEEEDASIQASAVMAELYTAMVGDDADEEVGDDAPRDAEDEDLVTQRASVFLTRVLFLLYGDDANLWEEDLFHRFVLHDTTADSLGPQLQALFGVLNTRQRRNVPDSMAKFPYVNGSLFADPMPVEFFTDGMREALLAACRFRWTHISPAVFGSMFQMVKKREFRRASGEHYTTEENITKTVGPLFLDELQAEADRLCNRQDTSGPAFARFQDKLASLTLIDPACGSGNFLTVAYGRLRDIETQIIVERRRRAGVKDMALDVGLETKVTIDQFHGIEINWWPAKIAETAMFLVDHQANRRLARAIGDAPNRLPITITAHIHHANALTTSWEDLLATERTGPVYLFGNPPFLGHDSRTKEQAAELRAVWGRKDIGRLDYVTAWHKKSADFLASRAGEFAYVTTNSITQGDQVPRLFGPLREAGWHVKFAHRTFAWTSEAPGKASVHCVIVGFSREPAGRARLWDYRTPDGLPEPVTVSTGVNAYLVDGPEVLATAHQSRVNPQLPPVTFGSTPRDGGHLVIKPAQYEEFTADPIASKYVRRFVGAEEILHGKDRWCLWLTDLNPADVSRSSLLRTRIEAVRQWRESSSSPDANAAAATPHLFWWRSQPDVDYLCIPSVVSERRRFFTATRLPAATISSNLVFTAPDPDGLAFAALSSSMFIAWQKSTGGRLESRLRFSSTLTWNNFPLPHLEEKDRQAMIDAGAGILAARKLRPDRTLAQAYDPLAMDDTLVKAHARLDRVVDKIMGAPRLLTSERQRQEYLFARYSELTS
ncbi:DNA methyltransferase [Brachybacterium paraconglomeratum]|uniref:DNA methyltransferase n=1 Tax=Brachybacterium paraconglomeratum TaxID=173362 RepID=UPI003F7BD8DB